MKHGAHPEPARENGNDAGNGAWGEGQEQCFHAVESEIKRTRGLMSRREIRRGLANIGAGLPASSLPGSFFFWPKRNFDRRSSLVRDEYQQGRESRE